MIHYSQLNWSKAFKWQDFDMGVTVPDEPGLYIFTDYDRKLQPRGKEVGTQVFYVGSTSDSIRTRLAKYKYSGKFSDHHGAALLQIFQVNLAGVILYIRWAVVEHDKQRLLSIEEDLIHQLGPSMNTHHAPWNQIR